MQAIERVERAELQARPLAVLDMVLIDYADAWEVQREMVVRRTKGLISDTLLLLEHPDTFTCGRQGGRDNILASEAELRDRGAAILDVDRGGNVTYHGPGQLVAYPILNLAEHSIGRNFHGYVRALEQVLIDTLAYFAIRAYRLEGFSGAWTTWNGAPSKIAAIGVKVDGRSITSHGIALNVTPDLSYFDLIVPCGISDKGVTSMGELLETPPSIAEVKVVFARKFGGIFGFEVIEFALRRESRVDSDQSPLYNGI